MTILPQAFCLLAVVFVCNAKLNEAYWWNSISFAYNSPEDERRDVASGVFVKENVVPVGMEVWMDKVFVTLPRWKSGVPASLAYFDRKVSTDNPKLTPYPNWAAHNLSSENKDRIISPFRLEADSCDRLWILDTGVVDIMNSSKFEVLSNPEVIVYNLKTSKRIFTFRLPDELIDPEHSFFANIVVDVVDCQKTYAYLADLAGYLVVFDMERNKAWRIDHQFFKLDKSAIDFEVNGFKFQFHDGLFGMALTEMDPMTQDRTMFFHPFSSFKEFKVSAKVLRDEATSQVRSHYQLVGERGPMSQANAAAVDPKTGVLLYTQVNFDAVGCWNYRLHKKSEYSADNQGYLAQDHKNLKFPNDVKVDGNGTAWILADSMTDFTHRPDFTPDLTKPNFYILTGSVEHLIMNTKCDANYKSGASNIAAAAAMLPLVYLTHKMAAAIHL